MTAVLTCVTSDVFHLLAHFICLHVDDEDQLSGDNGSDLEQNEENVAVDQKEEEDDSSAEDSDNDAEDDDSEESNEDDNGSDLESDGTFHFQKYAE